MERPELARILGAEARAAAHQPALVVRAADPAAFTHAFAAAAAGRGPVFLADPNWGANERAELDRMVDLARGLPAPGERGWLMIPSGGTGGRLKFARHDQGSLAAAVQGFCAGFGISRAHWVGVLPLHHVSGLMGWLRAALTGGEHVAWDWKRLEGGEAPDVPAGGDWFLSLVPTQLQRLLASERARAWLRGFRAIFLGGGPAWSGLLEQAAQAGLPLCLSYGLTETAAMVTAQRPGDFSRGDRSCGAALPHARVELGAQEGAVRLAGASLFRGYFPDWSAAEWFETGDLGSLEGGRLLVSGRRDAVIITGGEKADPAEIEAALRASGEFEDVAVIGVPDPEWGQMLVACHPSGRRPDPQRIAPQLAGLAPHKRPRAYLAVEDWPRNAQGKLNRAELLRRVTSARP